jgi:hypothetical protein
MSPLEHLVIGALCYMGRGWTFNDLEESTGISEEHTTPSSIYLSSGEVHICMINMLTIQQQLSKPSHTGASGNVVSEIPGGVASCWQWLLLELVSDCAPHEGGYNISGVVMVEMAQIDAKRC